MNKHERRYKELYNLIDLQTFPLSEAKGLKELKKEIKDES